eukprot:1245258-Pyramimonas_sp.AAC.1
MVSVDAAARGPRQGALLAIDSPDSRVSTAALRAESTAWACWERRRAAGPVAGQVARASRPGKLAPQ